MINDQYRLLLALKTTKTMRVEKGYHKER